MRYTILLVVVTIILVGSALFCLFRGMVKVQFDNRGEGQQAVADNIKDGHQNDHTNTVLLTLDIKNIDTLYRQLNSDSRKKIIYQLFQQIQKALNLYNGVLTYLGSSSIVIAFEQGCFEQSNAIFNAICCGHIVGELNKKQSDLPLTLTARIHHAPGKMITDEQSLLIYHKNTDDPDSFLAIEKALLESSNLASYLLIDPEEKRADFIRIHGFQPTYAKLLENQLKNLQDIDV